MYAINAHRSPLRRLDTPEYLTILDPDNLVLIVRTLTEP